MTSLIGTAIVLLHVVASPAFAQDVFKSVERFQEQALHPVSRTRRALLSSELDRSGTCSGWQCVPNLIGVFEAYATLLEQTGRAADGRQFRERAATIRKNYAR